MPPSTTRPPLREPWIIADGAGIGPSVVVLDLIVDDVGLRNSRLNLIAATRQVLENGLKLLGVSAPEKMERKEVG